MNNTSEIIKLTNLERAVFEYVIADHRNTFESLFRLLSLSMYLLMLDTLTIFGVITYYVKKDLIAFKCLNLS